MDDRLEGSSVDGVYGSALSAKQRHLPVGSLPVGTCASQKLRVISSVQHLAGPGRHVSLLAGLPT